MEQKRKLSNKCIEITITLAFDRSKKPMSAAEIANTTFYSEKEIESYLNSNRWKYRKVDDNRWYWKTNARIEFDDNVFSKLQNQKGADIFSRKQFDDIADWKHGKSHSDKAPTKKCKTKTRNIIECDSNSEVTFLKYAEKSGYFIDIGGQNLEIKCDTYFRSVNYYPDFVLYAKDGRIAVVEIKSCSNMSYHITIKKYEALANYCEAKKYMYMMIDPANDYMTFEEMRDMPVCPGLIDKFEELSKSRQLDPRKPLFAKDDVDGWYHEFGEENVNTRAEFDLQVKSMIIYKSLFNASKYGFEVYTSPIKSYKRIN